MSEGVIEEITVSLRESHKDEIHSHGAMLESYQEEYQKYEARIERMHEDKLDGRITESFHNKKLEEYRLIQKELTDKITGLRFADEEYYITS